MAAENDRHGNAAGWPAQRHAGVAWALAEELNRRLYDTLQQAAINAFGSVRQRVAAHLLDLASAQ